MVFSGNSCSSVQVIPLQDAACRHADGHTGSSHSNTHSRLWLDNNLGLRLHIAHRLRLYIAHWLRLYIAHRLWLSEAHWLRLSEAHRLRLHNHLSSWLDHDLRLNETFAEVMEDDFTKLDTFLTMSIKEMELDLLGITMDFRESDRMIFVLSEIKRSEGNLAPSAFEQVPLEDPHFCRSFLWVIACTLETNAFEAESFGELNLDPGSVVVRSLPLVPFLFTWTEQILWLAFWRAWSNYEMLSCHSRSCVQVISLHLTNNLRLYHALKFLINNSTERIPC